MEFKLDLHARILLSWMLVDWSPDMIDFDDVILMLKITLSYPLMKLLNFLFCKYTYNCGILNYMCGSAKGNNDLTV